MGGQGEEAPARPPKPSAQRQKARGAASSRKAAPAMALAVKQASRVIATLLAEEFGASNPAGGMETILEAFVEVGAPLEKLADLADLGRARLRGQLALGHPIQNQAGYYIVIMRDLAREALVKGWNVAAMREEDEAKYRAAERRAAGTGQAGQEDEAEAVSAEAPTVSEAVSSSEEEVEAAEPPAAAPLLPSDLPAGVELLAGPTLSALDDVLPDPVTGELRSLSMLWGFARQALFEQGLNLARRQHLESLTPKWDQTRPRTLLLLSSTTYTARFVAQVMGRDIQQQIGKRLYPYFDDVQMVFAPAQEGKR